LHDLSKEFYDITDHIERTLIKTETVGSIGDVGCSTSHRRDWVIDTIAIVSTLAPETRLNVRQQRKACEVMSNNNVVKVFVAMTDACQRDWQMSFIRSDED
jgi:hypothetical protein